MISHLTALIIILYQIATIASPIHALNDLSGGTGMNIRHLPCVSLITGETGVCMFAVTCVKSNGKHLGKCIDRSYFGSCCKLNNDDSDIHPQGIDDASVAVGTLRTTDSTLDSSDITDYLTTRPKPIVDKTPETTTSTTIGQTVKLTTRQSTTTTPRTTTTTTTTESPRILTQRPSFFSIRFTTTQPPIGLSTFQTLPNYSYRPSRSTTHNDHRVTTARPVTLKNSTSIAIMTGSTTARPTTSTILSTIATIDETTSSDLPVPMKTLNMSDYKQVCGRRLSREPRIVGGDHSSFSRWPWQISLRQWNGSVYLHKCGATLLNEHWAITAAHCVEDVSRRYLMLRIGQRDLTNDNEPYKFQQRRVQFIVPHSQFDSLTLKYDLALLRFYKPLQPFQRNILPICLPDDDENYVGHTAYLTGWGRLYENGSFPSILREVSVPVINNTVCEAMHRNTSYIEHITNIFICAGWRKGGFDSCEGDSGGPMVIRRPRDKRWILAGVISGGIGCARPNKPGVNTRISEFREWINKFIRI